MQTITLRQAAELAKIHHVYLAKLCRQGKIPSDVYSKPLGRYFFDEEKLKNWLAGNADAQQ